jgi:micrococcal nuclease
MEPTVEGLSYETVKPFVPDLSRAKVVKVYDGDTVTVATLIRGAGYSFRVRLRGIDAPEMRSRNPAETELAVRARDYLRSVCLGKVVSVSDVALGKFAGRFLGDVVVDGASLAAQMLEAGHARAYGGGPRTPWATGPAAGS